MSERLPDWYGVGGVLYHSPVKIGRELPGGIGDESSFIDRQKLQAHLSRNGNGNGNGRLPDEETAPSLLRTGIPDPTL